MIHRVRLAGVAVVLLLVSASVVRAQAPDTTSATHTAARPGRGSVGGQIGLSYFYAQGDYSIGASPRMSFAGHFRYLMGTHWQWQVSPYYTWTGYSVGTKAPFVDPNFPEDGLKKDEHLAQVTGANGQLHRIFGKGRTRWHAGGGPAVYMVWVENHRKVLNDPVSNERHKGTYLGASAEVGAERFLRSLENTSLEMTLAYQGALSKDADRFPSGYNLNVNAVEIRFGAHYYFDFKMPKAPAGK